MQADHPDDVRRRAATCGENEPGRRSAAGLAEFLGFELLHFFGKHLKHAVQADAAVDAKENTENNGIPSRTVRLRYILAVPYTAPVPYRAPKTMRRPGQLRRAAILEAATKLFLEHGYEKTSLSAILLKAGGSKSMIYEQFGDKAGLFRAVIDGLGENIFASIDGVAPKGIEPHRTLRFIGRKFIKTLMDRTLLSLTRIVYTEAPNHPELSEIFFSQGYDAGFEVLARYLVTIAPRPLPPTRLLHLSMMFFEMIKGDAVDRRLAGVKKQRSQRELDEQVDMAVSWLLQMLGIVAAPPASSRAASQAKS